MTAPRPIKWGAPPRRPCHVECLDADGHFDGECIIARTVLTVTVPGNAPTSGTYPANKQGWNALLRVLDAMADGHRWHWTSASNVERHDPDGNITATATIARVI